jgi:hypothetical protein
MSFSVKPTLVPPCQNVVLRLGQMRFVALSRSTLCALLLLLDVGFVQRGVAQCHGSTVADFSPSLEPKARAFLSALVASVKAGDKAKIAAMVRYPLAVKTDKGQWAVRSSFEFVNTYDQLLTPVIKRAIEKQVPECLFANWQGVMIGDGEVWFEEQQDGSMKIKTVNYP